MTSANIPNSSAGKLFFVSGLAGGREVFLGRALDNSAGYDLRDERLTLEGKALSLAPGGRLVLRPFATTLFVSLFDTRLSVQWISNPRAHEEAQLLLSLPTPLAGTTSVPWAAVPLVQRWVRAALEGAKHASGEAREALGEAADARSWGLFATFRTTAEGFRRSLVQHRDVDNARELDRLIELEGNLWIEAGKVANQLAIKLNRLLARERELAQFLEAAEEPAAEPTSAEAGGWPIVHGRLEIAKHWARSNGKVELVRELNALIHEGISVLDTIALDHQNSLDTLIAEALGQYGIPQIGIRPAGEPQGTVIPAGRLRSGSVLST